MAFSNTLQLTTVCSASAVPVLTTVFRLSSNNSVWQSALPLQSPTFLWQTSASYTGGWQDLTTWVSQTTSFLLTATTYDVNHNFRILENRRNSTVSLTSIGPSFSRSLTLTNLPSSENIELWLDSTKGLFSGLSALEDDNSAVALWGDLSRKERNPIQTVVNNFPVLKTNIQNGNNVLRFNGTSQFLEILNSTATFKFLHDGTQQNTVFVVFKVGNNSNPNVLCVFLGNNDWTSNSRTGIGLGYDDRSSLSFNNTYRAIITRGVVNGEIIDIVRNNSLLPNQYNTITYEMDSSNPTALNRSTVYVNLTGGPYQDNSKTGTPSTSNASRNLYIAQAGVGVGYFLGDLCEIIIYRGILTPSERSTVENYLKAKWATP